MTKILTFISAILILGSCSCFKHIPKEEIRYVLKDSTVTVFRDSVLFIPVERVVDVVLPYDTLKMETSLASSTAYVDTATHTLKGTLENKKGVEKHNKLEYKYIEKRDTTFIKVPVEVVKEKKVVPKWCWRLLVFVSIEFLVFAAWIYLKISKVDISSLLKKR